MDCVIKDRFELLAFKNKKSDQLIRRVAFFFYCIIDFERQLDYMAVMKPCKICGQPSIITDMSPATFY